MRPTRSNLTLPAILFLTLLALSQSQAADWPAYRGPETNGTSAENLSTDQALEIKWRTRIGSGYSGVSIAQGKVVTMFSDGTSDVIAAFTEQTGKELWRYKIEDTYKGHDGSHDGLISTPLIHDNRVFGLSARDRLVALDVRKGTLMWSSDLQKDFGVAKPHYGFGTSPLMLGGVLVLQVGGEGQALVGLDPATGERKWAVGTDAVEYQSPALLVPGGDDDDRGGETLVLAGGAKHLLAVDASNGEVIWSHEHGGDGYRGILALTPVPAGDGRIFLNHSDDGSKTVQLTHFEGKRIPVDGWSTRTIRNTYTVPVYYDGHLYGYSNRFLTCIDADSGEAVWRSRQPGDGFVTLVDGRLLIATKQGGLHVARATPDGYSEIVGTKLFDDLIWSAPSFANGHVFVRGMGELVRVGFGQEADVRHDAAVVGMGGGGSRFARFLESVEAAADDAARTKLVEEFMGSVEGFPLVEQGGHVHFLYRGRGDDLAIAGDMIGHRQERPMTRVAGTDLFYYSTALEADARVSYLFIRDFAEILDPRNPRQTDTMVVKQGMEPAFNESSVIAISWLGMPGWKPAAHLAPGADPGRVGTDVTHDLKSDHIAGAHRIVVHLPAGYDEGDRRYPVAYVHGGAAALERGRLAETVDRLTGSRISPVILVFVETFAPLGVYVPYGAMVSEDLIPMIDRTYRTIGSRDGRAHIGGGFSGFSALYCAFWRPEQSARVGTLSAVMLDFMRVPLEESFPAAAEHPFDIYIDWGKYDMRNPDEAWNMVDVNRGLVSDLRARGYDVAGAEHPHGPGWSVWRHRVGLLLEALFP